LKFKIGKYFVVIFDDEIIGGIMCPILQNKCIYELYVCGLDEKYKYQYPSVLSTWAAIQYANKNNIDLFDFMGAGRIDSSYGVREFKSKFGGRLVEHGRYILKLNRLLYFMGGKYLLFIGWIR
jgi:lipid II:glycine glycyltransferase (peptidoglycan interpeptide bridge formation enzyme)